MPIFPPQDNLFASIERGDIGGMRAALADGADPRALFAAQDFEGEREPLNRRCALEHAAVWRQPLAVAYLLDLGCSPDGANGYGWPLFSASRTMCNRPPSQEICELLIAKGATFDPVGAWILGEECMDNLISYGLFPIPSNIKEALVKSQQVTTLK